MEENEGSFKTKTSKILARTKVWPLGKSKFSAFGHLTEKVWNAIVPENNTVIHDIRTHIDQLIIKTIRSNPMMTLIPHLFPNCMHSNETVLMPIR